MPLETFRRGDLVFDVADTGPEGGPVVVLLHGFPQFNDSWNAVSERLTAQGYRCVAPNQRGYSPGARPRGRWAYRPTELMADVVALIDAIGVEKVHLVGHDWGAMVAWAVAAHHPHRVESLATFSVPHPMAFVRALVTSRQFFASWYIFAFQPPTLPELALRRTARFARILKGTGRSAEGAKQAATAMVSSGALGPAINWYRGVIFTSPARLRRRIAVPTMYVWSDGDTALRRKGAQLCGRWVSGPYEFQVLHGVSHWMPEQAPDAVADLLLGHLDR